MGSQPLTPVFSYRFRGHGFRNWARNWAKFFVNLFGNISGNIFSSGADHYREHRFWHCG
jgi:hypothetical protein